MEGVIPTERSVCAIGGISLQLRQMFVGRGFLAPARRRARFHASIFEGAAQVGAETVFRGSELQLRHKLSQKKGALAPEVEFSGAPVL